MCDVPSVLHLYVLLAKSPLTGKVHPATRTQTLRSLILQNPRGGNGVQDAATWWSLDMDVII